MESNQTTKRRQRPRSNANATTTRRRLGTTSAHPSALVLLLSILGTALMMTSFVTTVHAQFNEPPGQRREQTFRVREFELSNVNQHYPGDLRYYCTFRGKWSEERHPNDFPQSASWSAPVLISHSKDWRMWTGTETVTAGVEYMAEEGYPTILYNEFQNAGFETLHMIVGDRMYNTTESQHLPPINVTYNHPWLSAMTKITPSPDWFVGFSDFRSISYDTETFYNRFVIQSYVWDAGTDDGQNYLSFDRDLDPQVTCMRFCVPPHMGKGGVGTYDSNIVHKPGATQIHHPTGNTHKCPDKDKGRVQVPRAGQFLDYSASYIPFPAEYECVLRVGDGEVYAGNAFDESQIRPPKYVARPDDDFLDGISPYDQPAYDNYVESLQDGTVEEEEESWNKHLLWLLLLLLCCCCPCVLGGLYFWMSHRKRKKELAENETNELYLETFHDDGMVDPRDETQNSTMSRALTDDNIEEYDDGEDPGESSRFVNSGAGEGSSSTRRSIRSNNHEDYYGDDSGYGIDTSYNTGVSAGDDYDSWLASQNVSQQVEYEDEEGGADDDDDDDDDDNSQGSGDEDYYPVDDGGGKMPSLNTIT